MRKAPKRILLGRANVASPYLLYEDFSRYANSTVMNGQLPLVGPAWGTTGAVTLTTSGGKLIAPATGSGYQFSEMAATPQSIVAEFDWSGGADLTQAGMTIAYAASSNPFSLNDLLHCNMSPTGFNLTVRQAAGSFISIMSGNWVVPPTNNGVTLKAALAVSGNNATVLDPGGGIWSVNDSRIPSVAGSTAFWEPAIQTDGLAARVSKAYAYKAQGFTQVNYAALNPSDTSVGITLSNFNYTAQRTASGTNIQSRVASPVSATKLYTEATPDVYSSPASQTTAVGISSLASHIFASSFLGQTVNSVALWIGNNTDIYVNNVVTRAITGTTNAGDVFAFAIDLVAKLIWVKNITKATGWNPAVGGTQDPATGQGGISIAALVGAPYALTLELDANGSMVTLNSGWKPFVGAVPAGFSS